MKRTTLLFAIMILFILPALACGGGSNIQLPDVDEVAEQAAAAATKAAVAAATAVVVAEEAVNTAATVAASDQVQGLAATAEALATAASNFELPDTTALKEKFAAAQPDENGNITVSITEEEMNQAIQIKQAAAEEAGEENVVEETAVTFTGGNIVLTGSITKPITSQLTVAFRPYVGAGILQFEVISGTAGSVNVPEFILSFTQAKINNILNDAMGVLPSSFTLQDVIMDEGTMTITGHKN